VTFSLRFPAAVLLLFSFLSLACLLVCFGDGFDPLEVNCTSSFFFFSLSSSSSSFPKSRREFFPFHRFCRFFFSFWFSFRSVFWSFREPVFLVLSPPSFPCFLHSSISSYSSSSTVNPWSLSFTGVSSSSNNNRSGSISSPVLHSFRCFERLVDAAAILGM